MILAQHLARLIEWDTVAKDQPLEVHGGGAEPPRLRGWPEASELRDPAVQQDPIDDAEQVGRDVAAPFKCGQYRVLLEQPEVYDGAELLGFIGAQATAPRHASDDRLNKGVMGSEKFSLIVR